MVGPYYAIPPANNPGEAGRIYDERDGALEPRRLRDDSECDRDRWYRCDHRAVFNTTQRARRSYAQRAWIGSSDVLAILAAPAVCRSSPANRRINREQE